MIRYFLPLVLVVAVGALLWVGLGLNPSVVPSPLIGKPAPEFSLPLLDDDDARFTHADLRGRVTLVHVWATWCEFCRAEHPLLLDFAQSGIVPIVGYNYKDDRELARQWLARAGNPYERVLFDPAGTVAIDWGVYGTPETFVVDADGIIRYKHVGPLTPALIESELMPVLQSLGVGR